MKPSFALAVTALLAVTTHAAEQAEAPAAATESVEALTAELARLEEQKAQLETELASIAERIGEVQAHLDHVGEPAATRVPVVLKDKDTTFYKEPSLFKDHMGAVAFGAAVEIVGCSGEDFWQALVGDRSGWIHKSARPKGVDARTDEQLRTMRLSCIEDAAKAAKAKAAAKESQRQAEAKAAAARRRAEAEAEAARLSARVEASQADRLARMIEKYGAEIGRKIAGYQIWLGMTSEMARDSRGRPEDINRTVTASGVHEQWIYGEHRYLYFDNGILTSWQD